MTILRLSHVGVAVDSMEEGIQLWERLGLPSSQQEEVESARTRVSFHPVGESAIELLEGMDPDSPVARHLTRRGPGVHHLCFLVDDLAAEMTRLGQAGVRLLSSSPRVGAHGSLVCFLHPGDTGGVLVELNQEAPDEALLL